MNRLKLYAEDDEQPGCAGDYYVLYDGTGCFYVSRETASRIEAILDRRAVPRWITFTDLSGSRIRLLSGQIQGLYESTVAQRAAEREFHRARKLEEKADARPWED